MTEKDKELIEQARRLHYIDWGVALDLADIADTKEAKDILTRIAIHLHHVEEFYSGSD
ncbi:MAG: hypothetical protein HFJ91_00760 [Muribaculaceae bacterium]|nr:hypothetical protein [Muribaculaceae bacterium]